MSPHIALILLLSTGISALLPSINNQPTYDDFKALVNRLEHMESKMQSVDDLDSRVKVMEVMIRTQRNMILRQGRRLGLLESVIKFTEESETILNTKHYNSVAVWEEGDHHGDDIVTRDDEQDSDTTEETNHTKGETTVIRQDINVIKNPGSEESIKLPKRGIRASAEGIAFSTVLTHSVPHMGEHQMVVYDKVLLNDGKGYNHFTGAFTSPVSGVYLFMYHFGIQGVTQTWIHLMVNGIPQNSATAEGYHGLQELQGGNSAIVRLSQGDSVWVEGYSSNGHQNTLLGSEYLSSFSGVLLY